MATHLSVLAWEIPWTEEPGGLQSTGWQRVRRDLVTKQQTTIWIHIHTCPPTPRSLSFALIIVTTIYIFLWYLDWGQNTCNVSGPTVSSKNENWGACLQGAGVERYWYTYKGVYSTPNRSRQGPLGTWMDQWFNLSQGGCENVLREDWAGIRESVSDHWQGEFDNQGTGGKA